EFDQAHVLFQVHLKLGLTSLARQAHDVGKREQQRGWRGGRGQKSIALPLLVLGRRLAGRKRAFQGRLALGARRRLGRAPSHGLAAERPYHLIRSGQIGREGEANEHHFRRGGRVWRRRHLLQSLEQQLPSPRQNGDRQTLSEPAGA